MPSWCWFLMHYFMIVRITDITIARLVLAGSIRLQVVNTIWSTGEVILFQFLQMSEAIGVSLSCTMYMFVDGGVVVCQPTRDDIFLVHFHSLFWVCRIATGRLWCSKFWFTLSLVLLLEINSLFSASFRLADVLSVDDGIQCLPSKIHRDRLFL